MRFQPPMEESARSNAAPSLIGILHRPGTQRIHVHDYLAQNAHSVEFTKGPSCDFRAERALVMASHDDVVLLNHAPDPHFLDYIEALQVGAGREGVLDLDRCRSARVPSSSSALTELATDVPLAERAAALVAERLDPRAATRLTAYFSAAALVAFRDALTRRTGKRPEIEGGCHAAVELANDKGRMRAEARRLQIPYAPGELLTFDALASPDARAELIAAAAERLTHLTGRVIVRGTWSYSSADVHLLQHPLDRPALQAWMSRRAHVRSCLVDARLPLRASPNAQVWVGENGAPSLVAMTGQRLGPESDHCGNYFPFESAIRDEMETAALDIAQALGRHGYLGLVGVDLLELQHGHLGLPGFAFAETNGRMNASSYATTLFETVNERRARLGAPRCSAWLSRAGAAVGTREFGALRERLGDLLYDHPRPAGVIPYNTGLMRFGMVDLLTVAADLETAYELEREALARVR